VARLVLRLDGKRSGVFLGQLVLGPQPLEQIKSEISPKGFLDDLAVTPSKTRGSDLDRSQHRLVDRDRRPYLSHLRIVASLCVDASGVIRERWRRRAS
jgi:hypothetical protein